MSDKEENIKPSYFSIMTAEVRYDEELKPMEKILYSEITALSNKLGYCYASNSYFARLYKVDKLTVSRWISNLVKKKYLYNDMTMTDGKTERKLFINLESYIKYSGKDIESVMDILKDQGGLTERSMGVDQKINGGVDQKINLIIQDNNNKINKEIDIEISKNLDFNSFMKLYKDTYKNKTGQLDVSAFFEIEKLFAYCKETVASEIDISIENVLERLFYTFSMDSFYSSKYTPQAKYLLSICKNKKLLMVGEKPSIAKTYKKGQEQKERMLEIVKANIDKEIPSLTPEEEKELFGN